MDGSLAGFAAAMILAQSGFNSPFFGVAALQQQQLQKTQSLPASNVSSVMSPKPTRGGGSSVKTAKVWRYFDQLPSEEQAAECQLCRKKIKATNSSTTGMIRHLRSCHVNEYQALQEARQSSLLLKMEEKARAQLLRDMNEKVSSQMALHLSKKKDKEDGRESPVESVASSSSLLSSSFASSLPSAFSPLPPLPAPQALRPTKSLVEDDTEDEQPTDLSTRSAFSSVSSLLAAPLKRRVSSVSETPRRMQADLDLSPTSAEKKRLRKPTAVSGGKELQWADDHPEAKKISTQIAMMLLIDGQLPTLVDRPGFKSLLRLIQPKYRIPSATRFQTELVPALLEQLRSELGPHFTQNNASMKPVGVLPFGAATTEEGEKGGALCRPLMSLDAVVMASIAQAQNISRSFSHSLELSARPGIKEEDSDSSSSADSETAMPARIDSFLNHIGRYVFPHVLSLLAICRSFFSFFEDHPARLQELGVSLPPLDPSRPDLARDVAFVAANASVLSLFASSHPEADLPSLSADQLQFIRDLDAHVKAN